MDEKKYQVFVSSTYTDLFVARKKIIETVLSLYHFPVGMEMFSADDSEQWDIIKETIEASDYYVIIIGQKYGSLAKSGVSYTEMEYDYAKELGVPVLAFIRNPGVGTTPEERESDFSKIQLLENFIQKAKANKMCDFWDSIDDLATKVAIALPKIMRRTPRVGWVRGDQATSKEISNELAELSTENRMLREKVRAYESRIYTDAPVLNLSMIDDDLELTFAKNITTQPYVNGLNIADIPDAYQSEVSEKTLQEYNAAIPSKEKVDSYNKKMFLYLSHKEHAISFKPVLENVGKKLATDIYIHIELPSFIVAVNDENEKFFTELPELNIPVTPMEVIERRKAARKTLDSFRKQLILSKTGRDYLVDDVSISNPFNDSLITYANKIRPLNATHWIDYDKNRIVLRAKKLLQSLSMEFDEVTLVPIAEGQGTIDFKVVCEELKEPITFSRSVIVS